MTFLAWAAVAVFTVSYILIATEWIHRVAVAMGGAALMLLIGATAAEHAFFDEHTGIDWNVIFLLLGMMLIVAVMKRTGGFEYVAIWAAKKAKGKPFRIMVILVLVTAVASAFLDNVTTVMLIAPVTFLVCDRLGVKVIPFLIAEALASNIGGAATLVGDPPNIIIASRAGLTYNEFLIHMAPIIILLMIVFVGLCRWLFRKSFAYDPAKVEKVMQLNEKDAIKDFRLLLISLGVLALVTAAFVLHTVLHLEPSVVAMVGLVQAFMHQPALLILDEPTSGLDPLMQQEFLALVRDARDNGQTVFMSSHVLAEVQSTADRVAIVRDGRLAAVEKVESLGRRAVRSVEIHFGDPIQASEFTGLPGVSNVEVAGPVLRCTVDGRLEPLIKAAAAHEVIDLLSAEPDLEETFLSYYYTGEGASDAAAAGA